MATTSQPQPGGLFALKSMAVLQQEAGAEGADTLKRSLGALNLTLLGKVAGRFIAGAEFNEPFLHSPTGLLAHY